MVELRQVKPPGQGTVVEPPATQLPLPLQVELEVTLLFTQLDVEQGTPVFRFWLSHCPMAGLQKMVVQIGMLAFVGSQAVPVVGGGQTPLVQNAAVEGTLPRQVGVTHCVELSLFVDVQLLFALQTLSVQKLLSSQNAVLGQHVGVAALNVQQ